MPQGKRLEADVALPAWVEDAIVNSNYVCQHRVLGSRSWPETDTFTRYCLHFSPLVILNFFREAFQSVFRATLHMSVLQNLSTLPFVLPKSLPVSIHVQTSNVHTASRNLHICTWRTKHSSCGRPSLRNWLWNFRVYGINAVLNTYLSVGGY